MRTYSLPISCVAAVLALVACSSSQNAANPSASVNCGTVASSLSALKSAYSQLDAGLQANTNPADLEPIGAQINSLTFDITNQLQGASKESLSTVADGAQGVEIGRAHV